MQDNTAQKRTGRVWVYSQAGILFLKTCGERERERERERKPVALQRLSVFSVRKDLEGGRQDKQRWGQHRPEV